MKTPICDFVQAYAAENPLRLHMPGHKGNAVIGLEHLDITEIHGADSLYEADGIIAQSEAIASSIFGNRVFYSTEGSSQCIRAMLYLVQLYARQQKRKPLIAAGRNAHKTFLTAAGLLDLDVHWLYPQDADNYLSYDLSPSELDAYLCHAKELPCAIYITSPDYLGKIADIRSIAKVCHRHGVLLAVDNAHGAYLKFLPASMHPIDLGADLCCDSAHKTLPVLTGGAYLHLSKEMDEMFGDQAKNAMMLFGSTSPSYLILQSLDAANPFLINCPEKFERLIPLMDAFKQHLQQAGYSLYGSEILKFTIDAKAYGYTGTQLADLLRRQNIEPEFADPDFLVLMFSMNTDEKTLMHLEQVLLQIPAQAPIQTQSPKLVKGKQVLSIREAMLSVSQTLPIHQCIGRILAVPTVGCPPAVPILVCGEQIDAHAVECFSYYGIDNCCVVAEDMP